MSTTPDHSQGEASSYRAYLIGADGRIERSTDVFAEDDAEAIRQALAFVDGHAVELWDRGRKIIRFEPNTTG